MARPFLQSIATPRGCGAQEYRSRRNIGGDGHGRGRPTPGAEWKRRRGDRRTVEVRGRYRVEGHRLDRHGWWNVRLAVAASAVTDSLAFNRIR